MHSKTVLYIGSHVYFLTSVVRENNIIDNIWHENYPFRININIINIQGSIGVLSNY